VTRQSFELGVVRGPWSGFTVQVAPVRLGLPWGIRGLGVRNVEMDEPPGKGCAYHYSGDDKPHEPRMWEKSIRLENLNAPVGLRDASGFGRMLKSSVWSEAE
jgi:hypothetical protein